MTDFTLHDKRIVIAGLGLTGQACARFVLRFSQQVWLWDTRESAQVPAEFSSAEVILGRVESSLWQQVDLLIVSPGLSLQSPDIIAAREAGVEIIGDIELFARVNTVPSLGITGSNGKSTVTQLLTHILQQQGLQVVAAGNIGKVAIECVEQALDWVVLELSSFQLESTNSLQLRGATLLNLSDDHLDRHGTMAEYAAAKQRIFAHSDIAVVNRQDEQTLPVLSLPMLSIGLDQHSDDFGFDGQAITYAGEPVLVAHECKLAGLHNVLNIQAALALAKVAGVEPLQAAEAVKSFVPLPHRCVEIHRANGVQWIDDSKATNVGATLAAIAGLRPQVVGRLFLIAGGDAKGADLTGLRDAIEQHVDVLITLGKDGPAIAALKDDAIQVSDLPAAVAVAAQQSATGDVILLSPACASLDMFRNYQHRGEVFAEAVMECAA